MAEDTKKTDAEETEQQAHARMARERLGAGVGLGALSLGAAAIGAVCPMCVVAVPALIGSGIYHKLKCRVTEETEADAADAAGGLELTEPG
jgi:hypothetical protein